MQFLLDRLHEDTNRVVEKPYISETDNDHTISDGAAAHTSWSNYKARNDR